MIAIHKQVVFWVLFLLTVTAIILFNTRYTELHTNNIVVYQYDYDYYYKDVDIVPVLRDYILSINPSIGKDNSMAIADKIIRVSKENDIDWKLVTSVIETESTFYPSVQSWYGSAGLMQVTYRIHKSNLIGVGVTEHNIYEVDVNIRSGVLILTKYMEETGCVTKALKRYNGTTLDKYVNKVYHNYGKLSVFILNYVNNVG